MRPELGRKLEHGGFLPFFADSFSWVTLGALVGHAGVVRGRQDAALKARFAATRLVVC